MTSDSKIHFFGCSANRTGDHVSLKLDAAGDGSGNGGIVGKTVTSIDIVQDETGTAILTHLTFTGTAAVTAAPATSPAAAPTTPKLATTGGGMPIWPIGLLLAA